MSAGSPILQSGMFVEGCGGPRFRLVSRPASATDAGTIVFVHAFAEEMNKSRRMVARTARALAAQGWAVVQPDLQGCGDSAGDFGDASWPNWLADIADEVANADPDRPLWLWCHRGGALLASAALAVRPDLQLLLWQPALSGAQHLQQFLRLHAGARIVGSREDSSGPTPMQRLRGGEPVEIGGYSLSPALAQGMDKARLELPAGWTGRVVWLELSALDPPDLAVSSAQCVSSWRERGITISAQALAGPAFWQTQEIEECDELVSQTLQWVVASSPSAGNAALWPQGAIA